MTPEARDFHRALLEMAEEEAAKARVHDAIADAWARSIPFLGDIGPVRARPSLEHHHRLGAHHREREAALRAGAGCVQP